MCLIYFPSHLCEPNVPPYTFGLNYPIKVLYSIYCPNHSSILLSLPYQLNYCLKQLNSLCMLTLIHFHLCWLIALPPLLKCCPHTPSHPHTLLTCCHSHYCWSITCSTPAGVLSFQFNSCWCITSPTLLSYFASYPYWCIALSTPCWRYEFITTKWIPSGFLKLIQQ